MRSVPDGRTVILMRINRHGINLGIILRRRSRVIGVDEAILGESCPNAEDRRIEAGLAIALRIRARSEARVGPAGNSAVVLKQIAVIIVDVDAVAYAELLPAAR